MKILLVTFELTSTGSPRSLLNMALLLKKIGHTVSVVSLNMGPLQKEFQDSNIPVDVIANIDQIVQISLSHDLVIANTVFTICVALECQKKVNTVLFLREARNLPELLGGMSISDSVLLEIDKIACVSEYAKRFIVEKYGVKNIFVLHNYVLDKKCFKPNIVKEKLVHFCISGTIEPRKQQRFVIEAFQNIPLWLRSKCILHIIGQIPDWSKSYWTNLIGNNINVIFHGEISNYSELISVYSRMNVFIVASTDESCSLVALEGAMLGKALILSDHVGASYLLKNDDYIFTVGEKEQLTSLLGKLTSRKQLLVEGIKNRYAYIKLGTYSVYKKNMKRFLKWVNIDDEKEG